MTLHGPGNFFPPIGPALELRGGYSLRKFRVGAFVVPLVAFDVSKHAMHALGMGEEDRADEADDTGQTLWPSSTLVASLLLRLRAQLPSLDVLELGCGSGFCGCCCRSYLRRGCDSRW